MKQVLNKILRTKAFALVLVWCEGGDLNSYELALTRT